MKFLVIDDNSKSNQSIVDVLGKLGGCDKAFDGVEGLYMAESNGYDLIVLEAILPKKAGFEVIKEIRH